MENSKKLESDLFDLHAELFSLSALLKNIGACKFTDEEIHGIGLILGNYAKRFEKIGKDYFKTQEND